MDRLSVSALAERIPDGALLALPPDYSGCALAVVRELVRRGAQDLRLLGVPQLGLQADLLTGAGCVRELEAAAISLGAYGPAPAFDRARAQGRIVVRESSCPAIHAALTAAERGVPFMPLRGLLGSDLLALRPDWKVVDNPFTAGDPILLIPALRPEIALFHAPFADRRGNVWIGVRRELMTLAHAARRCLVSVERILAEDLLADERLAAGTIPALYIEAVAEAPRGARPLGLFGCYGEDRAWLARYASAARSEAGFRRILEEWLREAS